MLVDPEDTPVTKPDRSIVTALVLDDAQIGVCDPLPALPAVIFSEEVEPIQTLEAPVMVGTVYTNAVSGVRVDVHPLLLAACA